MDSVGIYTGSEGWAGSYTLVWHNEVSREPPGGSLGHCGLPFLLSPREEQDWVPARGGVAESPERQEQVRSSAPPHVPSSLLPSVLPRALAGALQVPALTALGPPSAAGGSVPSPVTGRCPDTLVCVGCCDLGLFPVS